jgi:hypothetical protein
LLASLEPLGSALGKRRGLTWQPSELNEVPHHLASGAQHRWELAIAKYETTCGSVDRERLHVLDVASTLLAASQWLEWLCILQRPFRLESSLLALRWQQFLDRLDRLAVQN